MRKIMCVAGIAAVMGGTSALAAQDAVGGAAPMLVFAANDSAPRPKIRTAVAALEDHVCRAAWETPAAEDTALKVVEARAQRLGANGLVEVRYERGHADQKSPCWEKLTVRATAVVFDDTPALAQAASQPQ